MEDKILPRTTILSRYLFSEDSANCHIVKFLVHNTGSIGHLNSSNVTQSNWLASQAPVMDIFS